MSLLKGKKTVAALMLSAMAARTVAGVNLSDFTAQASGVTSSDMVALIQSQVGYCEKSSTDNLDDFYYGASSGNYTKYHRDLGARYGLPWCAYFVLWCFQTTGMDSYPLSGACDTWQDYYASMGAYASAGSYSPKAGDVAFFDWDYDGEADHIGIVESNNGGDVTTIEGNHSDEVGRRYNAQNDVMGYGIVDYSDVSSVELNFDSLGNTAAVKPEADESESAAAETSTSTTSTVSNFLKKGAKSEKVSWVQESINTLMNAGLEVDGNFGSVTENAVKKFQAANGLDADGVVGPSTIAKLEEMIAGQTPTAEVVPDGTGSTSSQKVSYLKAGSKGDEVEWVQNYLLKAGYNVDVDGVFGSETAQAVAQFQADNGLDVDGVAGPLTVALMKEGTPEPTVLPDGSGLIEYGSEGEEVEEIQAMLNEIHDADLELDGKFGMLTLDAVMNFQAEFGLDVDGIVGPITFAKLREMA